VTAQRVVVLRHGRTGHNHTRIWQGQLDVPLDEVGRLQAKAAARALRELEPAAIVSSDLSRASATADVLAAVTGLRVILDPRLREVDAGRWEGLSGEEIVAAGDGDVLAGWRRGDDVAVGGAERPSDLGRRGAAALLDHAEALDGGTLVVVAHGAVLRTGVLTLLGVEQGRWQGLGSLENGAWGTLAPRRPWWRLLTWGLIAPEADAAAPLPTDVKAASPPCRLSEPPGGGEPPQTAGTGL
jgi:glucosyl-3-phosphoglycerate phosphatase